MAVTAKKVGEVYEVKNGDEILARLEKKPTDAELKTATEMIDRRDQRRKEMIAEAEKRNKANQDKLAKNSK